MSTKAHLDELHRRLDVAIRNLRKVSEHNPGAQIKATDVADNLDRIVRESAERTNNPN